MVKKTIQAAVFLEPGAKRHLFSQLLESGDFSTFALFLVTDFSNLERALDKKKIDLVFVDCQHIEQDTLQALERLVTTNVQVGWIQLGVELLPSPLNWDDRWDFAKKKNSDFQIRAQLVLKNSQLRQALEEERKSSNTMIEAICSGKIQTVQGTSGQIRLLHGNVYQENKRLLAKMKAQNIALGKLAQIDPLTALLNRPCFEKMAQMEIKKARKDQRPLALMFIDLDRFKRINDEFGHAVGDQFLVSVAKRFKSVLSPHDLVARIAGDEFGVVLTQLVHKAEVADCAHKILEALCKAYEHAGREVCLTASIGVAVYPEGGKSVSTLLRHADMAMYEAKRSGEGKIRFFNSKMVSQPLASLMK